MKNEVDLYILIRKDDWNILSHVRNFIENASVFVYSKRGRLVFKCTKTTGRQYKQPLNSWCLSRRAVKWIGKVGGVFYFFLYAYLMVDFSLKPEAYIFVIKETLKISLEILICLFFLVCLCGCLCMLECGHAYSLWKPGVYPSPLFLVLKYIVSLFVTK